MSRKAHPLLKVVAKPKPNHDDESKREPTNAGAFFKLEGPRGVAGHGMSTYQPRGPESQPLCIDRGILALLRGRITDEGIWGSSSSSTTVEKRGKWTLLESWRTLVAGWSRVHRTVFTIITP